MKVIISTIVILIIFTNNSKAQIVDIPDPVFKEFLLSNTSINTNGDFEIQLSEATNTNSIKCDAIGITSLEGIEQFINLDSLNCRYNELKNIDLSQLTNLSYLNCSNNMLDSLILTSNLNLKGIYAEFNNLKSIDVGQLVELTHLFVSNNNISTLDISSLPRLYQLGCRYNNLSELNLENKEIIFSVWCTGNNLSTINTTTCPNLTRLDIGSNNITNIDMSLNTKLNSLSIDENNIVDIDLSYNENLQYLNVSKNNLEDIVLYKNKYLSTLYCRDNNIYKINLDSNSNIQNLDVSSNNLKEIDIQNLTNLTRFNASTNNLIDANIACGNNINFIQMNLENNDDLYCITTDQGINIDSLSNSWIKDDHAIYNGDCCSLLDIEINESICFGQIYTSPSGTITSSTNGIILDTIQNEAGCDSTFTINLEIEEVNSEISQNQDTLVANVSSGYQWIDCSNDQPIEGETNQYFIPQSSGTYTVQIFQNGCYDTSPCYQIVLTSSLSTQNKGINVYPNPTDGYINIDHQDTSGEIDIVIRNSLGQIIKKTKSNGSRSTRVNMSESGIYYISIFSNSNLIYSSVVLKK